MGSSVIRRYERFLRLGRTGSRWDLLRARAVYLVALAIMLIQVINLIGTAALTSGWSPDLTIPVLLIGLMGGLSCLLRYTKNFVFFGAAFCAVLVLGAVAAASWDGSGINTALLPFLAMGSLILAFVTGWRASLGFLFVALGALAWLCFVSMVDPFGSGAAPTGREFPRLLQAVCAALLGTMLSCFLSRNAEMSLRRAERAEGRARKAARRALQAEAAKSDFLAQMSHELRTPLNGVIGLTDSLLSGSLGGRERALAETVRQSGEGLLVILNDLLDLSKIEAGKIVIEKRPADLRALTLGVADIWQETATTRGIALHADIAENVPPSALVDDFRIRQILNNLVSNALKFTEEGAVRLSLRVEGEGEDAVMLARVEDSGIGVPEAVRNSIFEPFEQGDKGTARRFGGTGLGLPICRQLATAMGGTVEIEWTGPGGTCFLLCLPAPAAGAEEAAPAAGETAAPASLSGLRVLAAEDNAINRMVLREFLTALGVSVIFAEDGVQCLEALEVHDVDLLLLDRHMPRMGGEEVARRLRAGPPPLRDLPLVAVTADAMSGEREALIEAGIDDVVPKPVRPAALAEAMQRALEARAGEAPLRKAQ